MLWVIPQPALGWGVGGRQQSGPLPGPPAGPPAVPLPAEGLHGDATLQGSSDAPTSGPSPLRWQGCR